MRLLSLFLASALLLTSAPTPFPPALRPELDGVIQRYLQAADRQRETMLGVQMEMEIDGRFTKLREEGRMRVMRTISKLGELGLKVLEFTGDNRIKTELIARYLDEEQKAKAYGAMKITPTDYDFEIQLISRHNGTTTYVFAVSPRSGGKGTFRGELWVDGATGMPLREKGRLVRSPSVFLTNLQFTRDYELRDGVAVATQIKSSTDVRLLGVGRAELEIKFSNYAPIPDEQAAR